MVLKRMMVVAAGLVGLAASGAENALKPANLGDVKLTGFVGKKLDNFIRERVTGERDFVTAAARSLDQLIDMLHAKKIDITDTGCNAGLPSCTVIRPALLLHKATFPTSFALRRISSQSGGCRVRMLPAACPDRTCRIEFAFCRS